MVPDASVTLTNTATGVVNTARTNERGFYSVPFLPPAFYKVEAAKAGFATVTRENLKLDVDQTARIDFVLRLGRPRQSGHGHGAAAGIRIPPWVRS
jgi:hypothetical protein